MSDEWVSASEDTPPVEKPYKNLSREVTVRLDNGEERIAFLNYNKMQWHDALTLRVIRGVCAWRDTQI